MFVIGSSCLLQQSKMGFQQIRKSCLEKQWFLAIHGSIGSFERGIAIEGDAGCILVGGGPTVMDKMSGANSSFRAESRIAGGVQFLLFRSFLLVLKIKFILKGRLNTKL